MTRTTISRVSHVETIRLVGTVDNGHLGMLFTRLSDGTVEISALNVQGTPMGGATLRFDAKTIRELITELRHMVEPVQGSEQ